MMKSAIVIFLLCIISINLVCSRHVFVGSTTNGIWIYQQKVSDGSLTLLSNPVKTPSGFLALHPKGRLLYATGESNNYVAYKISSSGANLTRLNALPGHDGQSCDPAHVSVHPNGRTVFGANYQDGSFVAYRLAENGSLSERTALALPGVASWGVPSRQEGPHAHMIVTSPNHKIVVGMDLGADRLWTWVYDNGTLTPNKPSSFDTSLGSGPRHIAFSPNGYYAYLVSELACTVTVLSFDRHSGVFTEIQTISSTPQGSPGGSLAAEIRVHPTGAFVYVSNRWNANNNIGVYSVNCTNGRITPVTWVTSGATSPRGMNLCPSGLYLYAAHEYGDSKGNSLFAFSINQTTGNLTQIGAYPNGGGCSDVEFSPNIFTILPIVNPAPAPSSTTKDSENHTVQERSDS